MATDRPRVYITLDADLYQEAERQARKKRISASLFLRDKIRDAMEWQDTFDILKDSQALAAIQESLAEIKRGESGTPWRKLFGKV